MNAIVGPATSWAEARSRTLLINGWPSEVMKIATGPLIPGGTTQLLNGRAMEVGWPPSIIWQKRLSVEPLMADELKVSLAPGATVPVLVIARVGFAGTPTSHGPLKKGPAIAKISLGARGISKAAGMAVPVPESTLRIV